MICFELEWSGILIVFLLLITDSSTSVTRWINRDFCGVLIRSKLFTIILSWLYVHDFYWQSVHHGAAKFVQMDELCLVRFEFIRFNISLLMSGERQSIRYTWSISSFRSCSPLLTTYILYLNRENECPNCFLMKQLVKKFRRWSKSKMILCVWRGEF